MQPKPQAELELLLWKFPQPEISQDEQTIKVVVGEAIQGNFPLPPELGIQKGDWALFYLQKIGLTKYGGPKYQIKAIDKIIFGKSSLIASRALRDAEDVSLVKGEISLTTLIESARLPLKKIKLFVVEKEGDKFFDYKGLLFDQLDCFRVFEGGILTIIRKGEILDQTSRIELRGTHGAGVCFVFQDFASEREEVKAGLEAADFQTGDVLVLEAPFKKDFDFKNKLRKHWLISKLLRIRFRERDEADKTQKLIYGKDPEEVLQILKDGQQSQFLRFRQNIKDLILGVR